MLTRHVYAVLVVIAALTTCAFLGITLESKFWIDLLSHSTNPMGLV